LVLLAEALIEYETLTAEQIERVVKGESIASDFGKADVIDVEATETNKNLS